MYITLDNKGLFKYIKEKMHKNSHGVRWVEQSHGVRWEEETEKIQIQGKL